MAGPSGATSRLALPYPIGGDTVDVPRDIKALADKLNAITGITPPLVTVLPATPVDGQECYVRADHSEGIIWHLRYRTAAPAAQKWEFLGGAALYANNSTTEAAFAGTTYASLPSSPPSLTLPWAGVYDITQEAVLANGAVAIQNVRLSYKVGATLASDTWAILSGLSNNQQSCARTYRHTVPAGAVILEQAKVTSAGTPGNISHRTLIARPVRLGP